MSSVYYRFVILWGCMRLLAWVSGEELRGNVEYPRERQVKWPDKISYKTGWIITVISTMELSGGFGYSAIQAGAALHMRSQHLTLWPDSRGFQKKSHDASPGRAARVASPNSVITGDLPWIVRDRGGLWPHIHSSDSTP
jgi:hypothetical protein